MHARGFSVDCENLTRLGGSFFCDKVSFPRDLPDKKARPRAKLDESPEMLQRFSDTRRVFNAFALSVDAVKAHKACVSRRCFPRET